MGDSDGGLRRWSVRIAKMQYGMYIGMCQIRQAQSHKFEEWNWRNIGHGHYCVTSHGYVYSHSDASANCNKLSFEFGTGDVLHFEYDPKQGKLTVQNQKGGRYEWSVERKGEKYAVCAYLSSHRRRSRIDGFVKNSRSLSKVALVYFSIGAIERMFSPITEVSSAVRFRRYGNGLQSDRNSDTFRIAPFVRHLRISLKPPIQHCSFPPPFLSPS
jgi:hypothetical protein